MDNGSLILIDTVFNGKKNWAVDLWDSIAEELDTDYIENESDQILNMILNKTGKNIKLLKEINSKLNKKIIEFQ